MMGQSCLSKNSDADNTAPDLTTSRIDISWPDDFEEGILSDVPDTVVENGKLTLDLSFRRLKSLPAKVCQRNNIEVLNLNCNKISNFPYNFVSLRHLKELYLRNNYLEFLPAQICTLIKLEVLELNRNLIETLPYCFSHLCHLQKLNLSFNNIKTLPPSLRYLTTLKYLNMEGNYLQSIPEVVVSLPSLEVLVLSDNEITFLHQDLDNLFQLKELYLDDNKLSELPASLLPYLAELEKLNLSNNKKVLTLGKNEKPKKRSQTKAKMNHVDAKVTTERLTGLGAPETSSTSVVAQDRSMVFSEINLNHPEEERDIFGGKPGLVNLKSEDADPNIAECVKRNTLSAKARVGQAMRPSPKWGILIGELKKAGFLPSIKVQLPKLRREERRPVKVVNHGSRYTWRGWRVDANSQSTLKRKTSSVESESLDNKLDEFGHLASISELFPEVKMEQGRLTLDLSWQGLSYVSGTICELVNLNSLLLDHNQVTDLPTGMDKLSKLRILSLNSNEMISLPENLRHLNYLRRLFLNGNHIRVLPDWFEGFQQLTYLSLENNDMPFFPTEICSLVKLEYLLLAGNKIGELPEKIKQLKKLRELFLGRNVIRLIPLSIAEMNSLRVLYLDNNGLEEIPYSVLSVMELQTLNLSGNSLNLIPDNIINLRDLEELDLGKNNIQKLPFWFHRLANLRVLSLNCNGMSVFPEVLCKVPNLSTLDLNKNKIKELPDFIRSSIGELITMQQLDLSYNELRGLPDSFRNLRSLEILHLEGNPLIELPVCMNELTNLCKLYLDRTITIPKEIFQLPKLEIL